MIHVLKPAAPLRGYVRFYAQLDLHLQERRILQPIAAHSAPCLDFTFGNTIAVKSGTALLHQVTWPVAVIGSLTRHRVHLEMHGRVENLTIMFEPGALYRLLPAQAAEVTDQDYDTRGVFGRGLESLHAQLAELATFEDRASAVDSYLLRLLPAQSPRRDVTMTARALHVHDGCLRISGMADQAGLSVREFERRFLAQIGVTPKRYSRIVRFESALKRKNRFPHTRWTDIAHQLGYHDQMHMLHDFKELAGATPSNAAPEHDMYVSAEVEGTRQP